MSWLEDEYKAYLLDQLRERPHGLDLHGELGGRLDFGDACRRAGERRRAVGNVPGALEGEDDVLGAEISAVMEFHAVAKLDFPGCRVDRLPRDRERRMKLVVGVIFDQPIEDVLGRAFVVAGAREKGIDR